MQSYSVSDNHLPRPDRSLGLSNYILTTNSLGRGALVFSYSTAFQLIGLLLQARFTYL